MRSDRPNADDGTAATVEPSAATLDSVSPIAATGTPDAGLAPTQAPASGRSTSDAPLAGRVDRTAPPFGGADGRAQVPVVEALVIVERSHYEVLGEFGRGGLGRVLRARDRRSGRIVAIKEALRSSPALLARFAREAIVTANLQHPAIVPVYEVGRWPNGEPFYAMKLVAGRSLADAARAAKTLLERLALLPHVIGVADALAYAHGERVIHRDLKPVNVLIGDYGETVVIDWGLAKRLDDIEDPAQASMLPQPGETTVGAVLGTPGYMAPEQARGEVADERADVYAIGAMLYEVLSRVRPHSEATSVDEMVELAASRPPRPLGETAPDLPRELIAIVERAMAFAPSDRYRDALALADDLKRFQTGQLVGAHAYTPWMLLRRWVRRHRAVVVATLIGVVALASVGAFSVVRIRAARDRAVAAQALAEDRVAALAEEQGRQLVTSGDVSRGLPYLAAAVEAGRRSPALAFVLGRALQQLDPIEAVLTGRAPIQSVSYSPDGTRIVTAGSDDVVRIWDPIAHRLVGTLGEGNLAQWSTDYVAVVRPAGEVVVLDSVTAAARATFARQGGRDDLPNDLAVSPNGDRIAVGGRAGRLSWWTVASRTLVASVVAHTGAIYGVRFSPDGAIVASGGADGVVKLWRATNGKLLGAFEGRAAIRAMAFSPDSKRIAIGTAGGLAAVLDASTGAKQLALDHKDSVEAVHFDLAGARVVTGSSDLTVGVWNATTGARLATLPLRTNVLEAMFTPDGKRIVTGTTHGDIGVWDAGTGEPLQTLAGHVSSVGGLAFSPDGKQLASCGLDGDLRLWRLDRAPDFTLLDNAGATSWRGTFSPDGQRIAITGSDGIARIYDGVTGAPERELRGHTGSVEGVAFSADGKHVATASSDETARVWDAATGATVLTLEAHAKRVRWVGYSRDGTQIGTAHDDGTARVWNAITGEPIAVLAAPTGNIRQLIWSPDGSRILAPLDGPGAALWDANGHLVAATSLASEFAMGAAWSPDSTRFVLGTSLPTVQVYDGKTGAPLATLEGHTMGPITALTFSPDGATTLSVGGDGFARLWTIPDPKLVVGDGLYRMVAASYRPDGALFATSGDDTAVSIWDAASGKLVGRLDDGFGNTQVWWSPDGERLLALRGKGAPRLWHVRPWLGTTSSLAARLRCTLRWRLDAATLVPATPDPDACHAR